MRGLVLVFALFAGCDFVVAPVGPSASPPSNTGGNGATPPPTTTPTPPPPTMPAGDDAGVGTTTPPPVDMGHLQVGSPCGSDSDCGSGLICGKSFFDGKVIQIPGGYCTMACANAQCPPNSVCTALPFGLYCSSLCPPDPCRTSEGYQCCDPDNSGAKVCTLNMLCQPRHGG